MKATDRGRDLENRTVRWLESVGYRAERVARTARFGPKDVFGVVDVLAVNAEGVVLAQVTTKTNASARRRKIREAGLPWPVRLFSWFKHKNRWTFTSEEVAPFSLRSHEFGGTIEAGREGVGAPVPALTIASESETLDG